MGIKKPLLAATLALLSLLLTSCIEGEEEVWVHADGSGRVRFEATAPTLLFAQFGGVSKLIAEGKAAAEESANITLTSLVTTSKGSRTRLVAEASFRDARQVSSFLKFFRRPLDSPEKSTPELLFGETTLGITFPEIAFSRKIDLAPLVPPESRFMQPLLGEATLTYRLHLPSPAKTHNATTISADRRTLEWRVPLRRFVTGPVEMNFTAPFPRLSVYLTIAGSVLLLLGGISFVFFRNRFYVRKPLSP